MKRLLLLFGTVVFVLLAGALAASNVGQASNPGTAAPLLGCSDVNGDGRADIADIGKVVSKFGTAAPGSSYAPLYDVSAGDSRVDVSDIGIAVLDFGLTCPQVDTDVAQATLAILEHPQASQILNENPAFLATLGYFRGSIDVPGQGIHYVHYQYFDDDQFNILQPEGLVYDEGKLVAQLYYVDGYAVGWGPDEPPNEDQVDIDQFCTPVPPAERCSFASGEDGWHVHFNLCTTNIGTPYALNTFTSNEADCEQIHISRGYGGTFRWSARVGWMGHLWNHSWVNPNGRFADCAPDENEFGPWKAFNCPQ